MDHFTDTTVTGRVTAQSDGLLYTSIPYEEGWSVKVDGEPVQREAFAGTMLAIPVTAGSHSIELSTAPPGWGRGS